MKVNIRKEAKEDTLLSHIILDNMSESVAKCLVKEGYTEDGTVIDLKLTANGMEIDIESFVECWQSQVKRIIAEKARDLINDQFADVNNILYDLEEMMKPVIEKRLEDWEKEENN